MKLLFTIIFTCFFVISSFSQTTKANTIQPDATKAIQAVEVSCGKCKLGLPGKTCDMAIRINDKAYYVDGADIDSFGDAHAHDGMCNSIRKAEVQGELVDDRFKVSYIKVLPAVKPNDK